MIEEKIKSLIKILEESSIDEIEISTLWGKQKIRVKKNSNNYVSEDNPIKSNSKNPTINESKLNNNKDKNSNSSEEIKNKNSINEIEKKYIKAPLVGTFYQSSKPGDPPFISKGDKIKEGQIICIIEAMKIFNEIESDISGTVVEILVSDASPIEYDQNLIEIIPD